MDLRSGQTMPRGGSSSSQSSSQAQPIQATSPLGDLNVSTPMGATMAMPVSTDMGVTAPSTVSTSAPLTRLEMRNVIPPLTAGVPSNTNMPSTSAPSNMPRLDDRNINMQNVLREQSYGMSTSMMANVHNSASVFAEQANSFTMHNVHSPSSSSIFGRNTLPPLTTDSMNLLRQQMDESNHDMVNLLAQQIGTVFNPLIRDTNRSYQALLTQMGRIADFFAPSQPVTQIQNRQLLRLVEQMVQRQQPVPQPQPVEPVIQVQPETILVERNDNADEFVRNIQQQNIRAHSNIANLVENIMTQNGLNIGLHRPNFVSPLSELVLQSDLPRGYKIPKFNKFARDTSESTVEHITKYLTEAGDLANDENLRLKVFPNSLTKNAFTWFTTLAPHSIQHWTKLEWLFHEQFYMGQSKISLKEHES